MKCAMTLVAFLSLVASSFAQKVRLVGSDAMVVVAQDLADKYGEAIEVNGGGSGIGVAALLNESAEIAMSARELEPVEIQKLTEKFGGPPVQTVVAYDALAIFVHKDNPVERITFDGLREVFLEGGKFDHWKVFGAAPLGEIVPFAGNDLGKAAFFRGAIGGKRAEFKAGVRRFSGNPSDGVELCAVTRTCICYSRPAAAQDGVKALAVAKDKDGKPLVPSPANVRDGSYPLARKLYFVTTAKADAATVKLVAFVTSPEGQKVVADAGLVPVKD